MLKFMSPAELRARVERWGSVPGNGAVLLHGIRNWLGNQLMDAAAALLAGECRSYAIELQGAAAATLVHAAGSEEEAQRIWCAAVQDALLELASAGWGVIPDYNAGLPSWNVSFRVMGPCVRHGVPIDPVIGGCARCLEELPDPDPDAVIQLQARPEVIN